MPSNNQLQYIAYGLMGLIVVILVMNVFITKINNNYNNSTFEAFGNIREGLENKETDEEKKIDNFNKMINGFIDSMCKNDKDHVNSVSKELAKMKTVLGIEGTTLLYDFLLKYNTLTTKSSNSDDYKNLKYNLEMINNIDILIDSLKGFDFDCTNSKLDVSKIKSSSNAAEQNVKSGFSKGEKKIKSWF